MWARWCLTWFSIYHLFCKEPGQDKKRKRQWRDRTTRKDANILSRQRQRTKSMCLASGICMCGSQLQHFMASASQSIPVGHPFPSAVSYYWNFRPGVGQGIPCIPISKSISLSTYLPVCLSIWARETQDTHKHKHTLDWKRIHKVVQWELNPENTQLYKKKNYLKWPENK